MALRRANAQEVYTIVPCPVSCVKWQLSASEIQMILARHRVFTNRCQQSDPPRAWAEKPEAELIDKQQRLG